MEHSVGAVALTLDYRGVEVCVACVRVSVSVCVRPRVWTRARVRRGRRGGGKLLAGPLTTRLVQPALGAEVDGSI